MNHSTHAAPAALTNPTLCSALRNATHSVHQRLHEAPLFGHLLHGTLSMVDYQLLLNIYVAFYTAMDEPLRVARQMLAANGYAAAERSNEWAPLQLLRADLEACGQRATVTVGIAPRFTGAQVLGCLYVAEGSRLGARVLHRQLDKLFSAHQAGRSFLGASVQPAAWQTLCDSLNALPLQQAQVEQAIAGATQAFALFEQLMSQKPAVVERENFTLETST